MARLDALIMPSAVAPSEATPHQALLNPEIRLDQTVKAILHWVKKAERLKFHILVADNTQYGHIIQQRLPKKVAQSKFLSIVDLPLISENDIRRGKGAGETSTLIAALELLSLPNSANVAKVNARYRTSNGIQLIEMLEEQFDFAAWPRQDLKSVDTTFFVGKVGFLSKAFEFVYQETNDLEGRFVEKLYAEYSIRNLNCNFHRFEYSPAVIAQSGSTGAKTHLLGEARIVSIVVKFRWKVVTFLRKYFRGNNG